MIYLLIELLLYTTVSLCNQTLTTTHFKFTKTGINATIAITTAANPNINGSPLDVGDEIGVYNSSGRCCGAIVWQNTNTAITAYGDDPMTSEIEGFKEGELISYKIWIKKSNKEYNARVQYISQDPYKTGFFYINGIYMLAEITNVSTNVKENISLPDKIYISQNYPNPFNPTTKIKILLSENSFVNLEIYDVNGKLIQILSDSFLTSGEHIFEWNGKNFDSNYLPTGIYFCKLKVNSDEYIRKMILIR